MPRTSQLPPNSLILITGLTGYLATRICHALVRAGYRVRGTVRSLPGASSKLALLRRQLDGVLHPPGSPPTFAPDAELADRLEVVEVPDVEAEGAFDDAVRDAVAVVHAASPCHYRVEDAWRDMVDPAVKGTVGILRSAAKVGKQVKAVVITSSSGAVLHPAEPGYVFNEDDWNDEGVKQLEREYAAGGAVDPGNAYRVSKTIAEKEAWKFMQAEQPNFSLATITPANIFGPVMHEIKNEDAINLSVGMVFGYFSGERREVVKNAAPQSFVDVRDVALMHIRALERPAAAGKRFIATSDTFTFQQLVDTLRKNYPKQASHIEKGTPGENYKTLCRYDNSRAQKVLGIDFIGLEKSVVDTVESLRQFAWMDKYL